MVQIIAEIGCNHKGELETAKEMIKIAAQFSKADVAKFQKADNSKLDIEGAKLDQGQQKIDLAAQKQQFEEFMAVGKQQQDRINSAFDNLKKAQEASNPLTVSGPGLVDNVKKQSDIVSDVQRDRD